MAEKHEHVILVNSSDVQIGTLEKMEAHKSGLLHRAVSVFIFNSKDEFLLQQRAAHKYHSAGQWSNTCCTHPFPGESNPGASNRRLLEEMGMNAELRMSFQFIYKAELEHGLIEHELDHVFVGVSDDIPNPNPEEVQDWKYISFADLENEINRHPENYTQWFKLIYKKVWEDFHKI